MVSISARQARGPWFDPWWREFSFKFHQSFLISKEKHIAHLKAFKKFASPYFQSPKSFPVPKILSSLQNHSISCKMKLDDNMSKCGKAVFRQERFFPSRVIKMQYMLQNLQLQFDRKK